jgi:hypothetical protein
VLRHQFGEDLVLDLDLLLQIGDPLLLCGVVGWHLLLEGSRPVLEELLLPAVEDRGLESKFIAELRDGLLVQQIPPQDGDFLFRRVVLPLLRTFPMPVSDRRCPCASCVLSITLPGERLLHFQLNQNTGTSRIAPCTGSEVNTPMTLFD